MGTWLGQVRAGTPEPKPAPAPLPIVKAIQEGQRQVGHWLARREQIKHARRLEHRERREAKRVSRKRRARTAAASRARILSFRVHLGSRRERVEIGRLRRLPLWHGPIRVETLSGGITNRNYLVRDSRGAYVVRFCAPLEHLGIDRRNEVICHTAARGCGIAPEVVYQHEGLLVSRFVLGRTLDPAGVRERPFLPRLANVLRQLHDGWDGLTGEMLYFSAFQTVRTYVDTARRLGARLPSDIDELLADCRELARRIEPFTPTLCHNDLLPANILDDGQNIWIVDWEYAGIGHPLFDLAGVSANCELTPEDECAFLTAYRGRLDSKDVRELRILKTISLLREALWSVIQTVASDLDFDYHAYASVNFEKYRRARALLTEIDL